MDVKKGRILIVDDDPANVSFLERILIREEFPYAVARDGLEGLDRVEEFEPDIILLDIMMPKMNGIEFCRRVRRHPRHAFRKILVVSGKAMLQERLEAYEAGADDYLVKPFKKMELLAKMRVFLRLKNMEELNRLKTDILSIFSHETRTPLTIIQGFLDLIRRNPAMEVEKRSDLLDRIAESTSKLAAMASKTILLCHIKMIESLEKNHFSLGPALALGLKEARKKPGSELMAHVVAPAESMLFASPSHFQIALGILLENAKKFSPPGETIDLEVREAKNKTLLSVTNTGTIEPQFAARIFDEFSVPDLMHHCHGPGLSLAIVRSILRAHGGEATLNLSTPGKVEFILEFPRDRGQGEMRREPADNGSFRNVNRENSPEP